MSDIYFTPPHPRFSRQNWLDCSPHSSFSLFRARKQKLDSFSKPTARLSFATASIMIAPLPTNGSRTVSSLNENSLMQRLGSSRGKGASRPMRLALSPTNDDVPSAPFLEFVPLDVAAPLQRGLCSRTWRFWRLSGAFRAKSGLYPAYSAIGVSLRQGARLARIRIFRIGGIFRISIRQACAFRHSRKSRQSGYGQAPAGRRTRAGGIP